jgi:2-succinyl-6-hydroxy-2,4-cyclohexadiene-1-carboxylate synthase
MSLLRVQRHGTGEPVVWLHGFTQTRESAHQFRTILAGSHEVWTLDLPGHGDAAGVRASLSEAADLVADALGPDPVDLAGYSFGARVALHVALRHPGRLRRLVVLGATRGIKDDAERAARRASDEALAARLEEIGVDRFLDEWLAQPLFARLGADEAERAARSRDGAGLAATLRTMGTGTQAWLGERLGEIDVPTLCLAGALDAKFSTEAGAIAVGVRDGRAATVPDAGHAAHLERPRASATLVLEHLA